MKKIVTAIVLFGSGYALGRYADSHVAPMGRTEVLTRVDTVTVARPVPVVETIVREVTVRLPDTTGRDTVAVVVPVYRRVYETEDYRATVSGYRATLDSLTLYPRTVTVTTAEAARRQSRLSLGIQAGYGMTPRGPQPYVGIGVSYRIF